MNKGKVLALHAPAPLQRLSFISVYQAVACQVRRWRQLHRERRELAGLSDRALVDIGLHRYDVEAEARRPFWDDPLKK